MAPRSSAKRSYRKRVRSSPCRGKGPAVCRATKRCKYVSKGKKRSFCRKTNNTRRRVGVRTRAMRRRGGGMRRRSNRGMRRRSIRGGAMLPLAPHAFPEPNDNLRGPPFPPLGGPTHA